MTEDRFRRLALSLPEAEESSHMGHPDFRVAGKIFATLGSPRSGSAMVKLNRDQREQFIAADPESFTPVAGGWGKTGATYIQLEPAPEKLVAEALRAAWTNSAPRRLTIRAEKKKR